MTTTSLTLDRQALIDWYTRNRQRSKALFDLVGDEAYYARPDFAASSDRLLRRPPAGVQLQHARQARRSGGRASTPARDAVRPRDRSRTSRSGRAGRARRRQWPIARRSARQFADEADRRVLDALANADLDRPGHPLLDRAEAAFAILEHEAMHQETLLYMWHRLPFDQKRRPQDYRRASPASARAQRMDRGPGRPRDARRRSRTRCRSAWDNEFPARSRRRAAPSPSSGTTSRTQRSSSSSTPAATRIARWWRAGGLGLDPAREQIAHPLFWERHDGRWYLARDVRSDSAAARRGRSTSARPRRPRTRAGAARGCRPRPSSSAPRIGAPTADERRHPWGDAAPRAPARRLRLLELGSRTRPAAHPAGRSAWGVDDLVGNGWEWTEHVVRAVRRVSRRCPRIRSTRRTSSTANTS